MSAGMIEIEDLDCRAAGADGGRVCYICNYSEVPVAAGEADLGIEDLDTRGASDGGRVCYACGYR